VKTVYLLAIFDSNKNIYAKTAKITYIKRTDIKADLLIWETTPTPTLLLWLSNLCYSNLNLPQDFSHSTSPIIKSFDIYTIYWIVERISIIIILYMFLLYYSQVWNFMLLVTNSKTENINFTSSM